MAGPFVSIVIPVLNDAEQLGGQLAALASLDRGRVQCIVAQGGDADAAMRDLKNRFPDVVWLKSAPGRAVQLNAGARRAVGRWILFLHADARLDAGWVSEVERKDADPRWVGGSFRFVLDSPAWPARLIEWGVAWRVRLLNLPYGDQAIFVRRQVFEQLHGYRDLALMEDVDLIRRLRRVGRLWHSTCGIRVSARRWERDGWWRRSVENMLLALLYHLGVRPERLARMYYRRSPRSSVSREMHETES